MKTGSLVWLALAVLVICAPGQALACKKQRPLGTLAVEITENGMVLVPAKIDGRDVWLYLQLAQGVPTIYESAVKELGLEAVSQSDVKFHTDGAIISPKKVSVNSLVLGRAEYPHWDMYVRPYAAADALPSLRGVPIIGVLTSVFMTTLDLELNLAQKQIKLFEQTDCGAGVVYWGGSVEVMDLGVDDSGLLVFPLEIDGKKVEAALNTGGGVSRISEVVADAFLGFNRNSPGVVKNQAGGKEVATYRAMALTAKGLSMPDVPMRLQDDVNSGCQPKKQSRASVLGGQVRRSSAAIGFQTCSSVAPVSIGTELLAKLRIYIAPGQGKIYFTRVGDLPEAAPAPAPPAETRPRPRSAPR